LTYAELLQEGLLLTGVGMGVVFAFLTLLVIITGVMSKALARYFPEQPKGGGTPFPSRAPVGDAQLLAVISAAIHKHRSRG